MARVPLLLFTVLLGSLPGAASAETAWPTGLHAGQSATFTLEGFEPDRGVTLKLEADTPETHFAVLATATGTTDSAGRARLRITMPDSFSLCPRDGGPCEEEPVFPGLRVYPVACSAPERGPGAEEPETSSTYCEGGPTLSVTGPRATGARMPNGAGKPARLALSDRRVGRLRWRGWGTADARATGRVGRRRAVVHASDLVVCGGRVLYRSVVVRAGGVRRSLPGAPCATDRRAQVFPG
jgi:hypothetical protein